MITPQKRRGVVTMKDNNRMPVSIVQTGQSILVLFLLYRPDILWPAIDQSTQMLLSVGAKLMVYPHVLTLLCHLTVK